MAKAGAVDGRLFVPFAFPQQGDDRPLLALNPGGTRLAISWEGADSVRVFDARTGRAVTSFPRLEHVNGVEFFSARLPFPRVGATSRARSWRRTTMPIQEPPAWEGLDRAVTNADWSVFAAAAPAWVAVWHRDHAEP